MASTSVPRLSGRILRAAARATERGPLRLLLGQIIRRDLRLDALRALPWHHRDTLPLSVRPAQARSERPRRDRAHGPATRERDRALTADRLTEGYRSGALSPVEVVKRCFEASRTFAAMRPAMDPLLYRDEARALRDAEASLARWRAGRPLGPLDGVPVPVKEELDLEGQGFRLGTAIEANPAARDAEVVRRLRAAGAIVLGQTSMTEYGLTPLGVNPLRVLPRNAVDPRASAGGSSTGSAVSVAAGLAPVAIGSDGGGSIRIPSCFNGIFGIKPTFGRVSRAGDGFGGTMSHIGPLGSSVIDLARALEVVGGEDGQDILTVGQPAPVGLVDAVGAGVRGMRIGVLESEIDAAVPACAAACREALAGLEREGAVLVPVQLGLAEWATAIGYLSIGLEGFAALLPDQRSRWSELSADLQLFCTVMSTFKSDDYLDAQMLRAGLRRDVAQLLRDVDVLALPTTARPAPDVSDADVLEGMSDPNELDAACRFAFLGNLTGLPAGTAPVGRDGRGLPFGLQIVGDAWDEASVLAVLGHLERAQIAAVPRPKVWAGVLETT